MIAVAIERKAQTSPQFLIDQIRSGVEWKSIGSVIKDPGGPV
jgi:hypothetical protein